MISYDGKRQAVAMISTITEDRARQEISALCGMVEVVNRLSEPAWSG